MADPVFFARPAPITLAEVAQLTGSELAQGADPERQISDIAPLDRAGPSDIAFIENTRYLEDAGRTRAGACFASPRHARRVAPGVAVLVNREPKRAIAVLTARLYPDSVKPAPIYGTAGISPAAHVHPTARLEDNVTVEPGAIVGPGAEIGSGTLIGPYAVIGPSVRIGRDCVIETGVSIIYSLIGDRVILRAGTRVGQDSFGFVPGRNGHLRVPQVGRVVIQNDVEIGADSVIDRGANRDTVIGEGTKAGNQIQIGHNVVVGRHCLIVGQVGIAGSATVGDFVSIGGQTAIRDHATVGDGAQIGAVSGVFTDVPPGGRWGGMPARPVRHWLRELNGVWIDVVQSGMSDDDKARTSEGEDG